MEFGYCSYIGRSNPFSSLSFFVYNNYIVVPSCQLTLTLSSCTVETTQEGDKLVNLCSQGKLEQSL